MIKNVVADRIAKLGQEQLSSWKEIHHLEDGDTLAVDWETLPRWTPEHRLAASSALSEWCLTQTVASEALASVEGSDARIGAWLACVSARSVVHMLPSQKIPSNTAVSGRPEAQKMLGMVENWVRGRWPLHLIRDQEGWLRQQLDEALFFSGMSELEHVRSAASSSHLAVFHACHRNRASSGKSAHYAAVSIASLAVLRSLQAAGSKASSRTAAYGAELGMMDAFGKANRKLLEALANEMPSAIERAAEGYENT